MHQGNKPASLVTSTAVRTAILFAVISVATPAKVIWACPFTLRLRGPFVQILRAGFHPSLLSGTFFFEVLVLFNVTI